MELKKYGKGREGHGSIQNYYDGKKTIEEIRSFQSKKKYPGNAPPMRAIPLGFMGENMFDLCMRNANTTHPHPKPRAASYIIALATKHLLIDQLPQQSLFPLIIEELISKELDEETIEYLKIIDSIEDYHLYMTDEILYLPDKFHEQLCGPQPIPDWHTTVYGLPSDSMRTAGTVLYILKYYKTPFEALKVCMWIGGDVDSLGSIVLGIIGAKEGLSDIPERMKKDVEDPDYLISIGEGFKNWLKL